MLLAAAAFAACSDDDITRDPSPETAADCQDVYFTIDNEASATVAPTATEYIIWVERTVTDQAAEVPVKAMTSTPECFSIPATVSFAAGQSSAELAIGLLDAMEYFQTYNLTLEIDPAYADYYTEKTEGSARWNLQLMKSDYRLYAQCAMTAAMYGQWWRQDMEYSELLDRYRLVDAWDEGLHFEFTWDGGSTFKPVGTENGEFIQIYIGPYDATHEMYILCAPEGSYDADEELFYLDGHWYVTGYGDQGAGSGDIVFYFL